MGYSKSFKTKNTFLGANHDYNNFGLFSDKELIVSPYDKVIVKERLIENYGLYEKVESINKYGRSEQDFDKYFDDHGADILGNENWKETDFSVVWRSNKEKLKDRELEYIESNKKSSLEGLRYWDRPDGESKVRQRKRNIIVFNPDQCQEITLEFGFNDSIKKQYIDHVNKKNKYRFDSAGKKIRIQLEHEVGNSSFYTLRYKTKTSALFEFRIVVVECNEQLLESFQTAYTVNSAKDPHILIHSDENKWVLNEGKDNISEVQLIGQFEDDQFEIDENQMLIISKSIVNASEDELVRFQIILTNSQIPFAIQDVFERPVPISGFNVWKLKREKQEHFKYYIDNEKMKIVQGTRETYAQGEFKKNLERELKIIELEGLYFHEINDIIQKQDISVSELLKKAYLNLLRFFKANQLLPSLAYLNVEYTQLATSYLDAYLLELNSINDGQSLDQMQRDLALIGTIQRNDGEREWYFTPLHPINVAYQLQLNSMLGEELLIEDILKSLRPIHLLPYVKFDINNIYKPIEQTDSYEWALYVDHNLPRYEGTRSFINKLVQEKIEEFTRHFSYLFSLDRRSALKINVINMGDCREVLQGLFEYYKLQLKEKNSRLELLPIDLCIYAVKDMNNVFEELSKYTDIGEISKKFGLRLQIEGEVSEELLNVFRHQVRFYSKDVDSTNYEYSHITFYQMSKIEQIATSSMSEIVTGVSLFGLVSGVPSVFINGDYKTGFGSKYYLNSDIPLLSLIPKLNSLLRVARSLDVYHSDTNVVTAISDKHKKGLDRVYNSAHWVTFVEPRVDLSFFKNDEGQKDLLVIHYSDQYTSSSGFDAITVTRRSEQYQQLINEFLISHQIQVNTEILPKIINFFNAINGNWLLRLLAQQNHFPKEKISILSAVKLALASFAHPNIIWIPISMEEVLRISGGTGLKQSEGLFSAKNLLRSGSFSDDLLLIGVEKIEDQVFVHFYPIEVKIGNNSSTVKEKAIKQVKETKNLLIHFLKQDSFQSKIYRNFFIQLAIASAEKMKLYDIWPEYNWDQVTNDSIRQKLVNDQYQISDNLDQYIGQGGVISFKKDVVFIETTMTEDVFILDYPEKSGYDFLIKEIENIKEHLQSDKGDIPHDQLLTNLYNPTYLGNGKLEYIADKAFIDKDLQKVAEAAATMEKTTKPLEVLFGHNSQNDQEIKWYPTTTSKVMHTNTGIIGTMGTGKTQFTKSLITQLHRNSKDNVNGTPIGILIFDYKGDYIKSDFVDATGANVYKLYHLPYNPLSLYVTELVKPLLPLHTSNSLTDTISTAFNLGPVQRVTLKELIMEAYAGKGIHKSDSTTWNQPAPTFEDIYQLFSKREGIKIDSLYASLNELYETEVFESDASKTISLFEMIDGVSIIDLSGFNESIQNLVVAITLDVFYNQMQMEGHSNIQGDFREITRMILVDEADNFLSKDFKAIKKILKEGREYGVGTILSTQFLNHFSTADNDYANYILTWIVHNVSEMSSKDIRMVFNTQTKTEEENIMNRIKSLEKHHSIVKGVSPQPVWIRDKAFWELGN